MDRTVARGSDIPTASLKAARGAITLRVTNVDQAQAQEAIDRARADGEALVHAEADRDQAREQAEQYRPATQAADQRTAAGEARAEDARTETARVRQDAGLELEQLRIDAARERDELRAALESRDQVLEELRARAERAERARLRQ